MEAKDFVVIGVLRETREKLKYLAIKHRTSLYQLVQTLVENEGKIFCPDDINNDSNSRGD